MKLKNKSCYKILCQVVFICAFLLLTACSSAEETQEENASRWKNTAEEVQGFESYPMQPGTFQAAGEQAYYISMSEGGSSLIAVSVTTLRPRELFSHETLRSFCVHPDGQELACYLQTENGGTVRFLDANGKLLRELSVEDTVTNGQLPQRMCLNSAGDLALLFGNNLAMWDAQGNSIGNLLLEDENIFNLSGGENGKFLVSTFHTGKNSGWLLEVSAGSDSVKRSKKLEAETTPADEYSLPWNELGIVKGDILDIAAVQDKYYVWTSSWMTNAKAPLFCNTIESDTGSTVATEKQVVTVVTQNIDQPLDAMAIAFNRQSEDTEIVIEHLDYDENAWNLRLASRENIDLVIVGTEFPLLQKAGYLEALNPYLDSLGQNTDEIIPAFLACWQVDGETYGIPKNVTLSVPYVRISGESNIHASTAEELLALLESHPELKSENGLFHMEILRLCLYGNLETYLTGADGSIQFQTDTFKELCLSIKNLHTDQQGYFECWEELLESQDSLFGEAYLSNPKETAALFQRVGTDVSLLGYPTADGQFASVVSSRAMCLIKQSDNREKALDFLRFYYDHYEEYYPGEEWATNETALKLQLEEAGKEQKLPDGTTWALSDEQRSLIMQMVEGAKSVNPNYKELFQIISEEMWPYFTGDRALEDAVAATGSKIGIFLSE